MQRRYRRRVRRTFRDSRLLVLAPVLWLALVLPMAVGADDGPTVWSVISWSYVAIASVALLLLASSVVRVDTSKIEVRNGLRRRRIPVAAVARLDVRERGRFRRAYLVLADHSEVHMWALLAGNSARRGDVEMRDQVEELGRIVDGTWPDDQRIPVREWLPAILLATIAFCVCFLLGAALLQGNL